MGQIPDAHRRIFSKILFKQNNCDTGAMIPYSLGFSSDGMFNLGNAIAFAQVLPPGVYIAMNGKYFPWSEVKKNKQTGYFEKIEN